MRGAENKNDKKWQNKKKIHKNYVIYYGRRNSNTDNNMRTTNFVSAIHPQADHAQGQTSS